ncbi:MAG: hypothetical protein QHH75_05265 [Bacillota bacterium]|nr:hypothetical protein [Bacillota bacterium]
MADVASRGLGFFWWWIIIIIIIIIIFFCCFCFFPFRVVATDA